MLWLPSPEDRRFLCFQLTGCLTIKLVLRLSVRPHSSREKMLLTTHKRTFVWCLLLWESIWRSHVSLRQTSSKMDPWKESSFSWIWLMTQPLKELSPLVWPSQLPSIWPMRNNYTCWSSWQIWAPMPTHWEKSQLLENKSRVEGHIPDISTQIYQQYMRELEECTEEMDQSPKSPSCLCL